MRYPFLENNQLVLIDYVPGSSGQLLLRAWAELDSKLMYDNPVGMSEFCITSHPSSREIDYDITIPKKMTNWFLDKCEPGCLTDYLSHFDMLGTSLVAFSQPWASRRDVPMFYPDNSYRMEGHRMLYAIHTWEKHIPFDTMQRSGYGIRVISIVPKTEVGMQYQYSRAQACYPRNKQNWITAIENFNSKPNIESVDFCTMLVRNDIDAVIAWLEQAIGSDIRVDKIARVRELLSAYCDQIVNKLELDDV
jgi:hypothetical protein